MNAPPLACIRQHHLLLVLEDSTTLNLTKSMYIQMIPSTTFSLYKQVLRFSMKARNQALS